ncbi:GNAT family N-acetyltransferase [Streptomyces sp. NPDC088358]|uniref:GNAT family N-acetyltransferase n=1 Tax=Streptomyces sp. NPDC088358 TaxID=3365857 RepID=UPI003800638F
MIQGDKVGLRARRDSDVPVLQAELYDDVAMRSRVDSRPWRPLPPDAAESPAAAAVPSDDKAYFSVVELASQELAGEALLWGIDPHNRTAHLGISLLPRFRGRGLAGDVVRVLCTYGFTVRGLQRLQVETLADNTAMIAAATGAGFRVEGTLRRSAWVYGAFVDVVVLGLLDGERTPPAGPA